MMDEGEKLTRSPTGSDTTQRRMEDGADAGDVSTEALMRIDVRVVFGRSRCKPEIEEQAGEDENAETASNGQAAGKDTSAAMASDESKLSFFATVPGHGDLASATQPNVPRDIDAVDGSVTLSAQAKKGSSTGNTACRTMIMHAKHAS